MIIKSLNRVYLLAVTLSVLVGPLHGQSTSASRGQLISAAKEIMTEARYCALTTFDRHARANVRAMDPFPPDDRLVVWFGTNARSRKVDDIRRNSRVVLYYFNRDAQEYVTIHGRARLVNEAAMKSKWWKEEWKPFYPDRGNDYLLIEVAPVRLEVVSEKKKIFGDPKTWKPPMVYFEKRR